MAVMKGELTQIQHKAAKYNSEGDLVHDAYATVTMKVYMNTKNNMQALSELIPLTKCQNVYASIAGEQMDLFTEGMDVNENGDDDDENEDE